MTTPPNKRRKKTVKEITSQRIKTMKAKVQTKEVEFDAIDEGKVSIKKLNLRAVKELQEMGKTIDDTSDFESNLDAIKSVIKNSVVGAEDMADEDFDEFAIGDLADLQQKIMEYSGLAVANLDNEAPEEGND